MNSGCELNIIRLSPKLSLPVLLPRFHTQKGGRDRGIEIFNGNCHRLRRFDQRTCNDEWSGAYGGLYIAGRHSGAAFVDLGCWTACTKLTVQGQSLAGGAELGYDH